MVNNQASRLPDLWSLRASVCLCCGNTWKYLSCVMICLFFVWTGSCWPLVHSELSVVVLLRSTNALIFAWTGGLPCVPEREKALPNIYRADVWCYMVKLTNTKDERKKQKLWMKRGLSADCFSPSELLPASSSPALSFLAHFSFLLRSPPSPLPFCLSPPLGEKML